jgi:hypothetical protein
VGDVLACCADPDDLLDRGEGGEVNPREWTLAIMVLVLLCWFGWHFYLMLSADIREVEEDDEL